jgi:hypothetical protein
MHRRKRIAIITLLGLTTPVLAATGCPASATTQELEQEIFALDQRYLQLVFDGRLNELQQLLAPGYVHVHSSSGALETRDSFIEFMRTRFEAKDRPPEVSDVEVIVYDAAAIIVGRSRARVEVDGQPVDIDHRFLRTYVRQGGRWLLASNQSSRVK